MAVKSSVKKERRDTYFSVDGMGGAGILPSNCLDEKFMTRDSFCRSVSMMTSLSGEPSADASIASYPESWCMKEAGAKVSWGAAKGLECWKVCV